MQVRCKSIQAQCEETCIAMIKKKNNELKKLGAYFILIWAIFNIYIHVHVHAVLSSNIQFNPVQYKCICGIPPENCHNYRSLVCISP